MGRRSAPDEDEQARMVYLFTERDYTLEQIAVDVRRGKQAIQKYLRERGVNLTTKEVQKPEPIDQQNAHWDLMIFGGKK